MSADWKPRTRMVHSGIRRSQYGEVAEAIFLTQGFVYPDAATAARRFEHSGPDEFIYARYGNPTVRMFEDRIAAIEGTEAAFATSSGMAAVNAALTAVLQAGDHVVAARALFGSCLYILDKVLGRFGVEITLVDGTDLDAWRAAVRPGTKAVFFETVSNPTLEIIDVAAVCDIAHAAGAIVVADNVFATPVGSTALDCGVDVVVYSTTKHIDGQGRCLGGVICGTEEFIRKTVEPYVKHTGGAMSPFNAWVMLKGMETLELRVAAQAASAEALACELEGNSKLSKVIYPGLASHPQHALARRQMPNGGTLLALELAGGQAAAFRFIDALKLFTITNNLGDSKSLITHPATTTHSSMTEEQRALAGVTPGLVRVSLGIEATEDILADVRQALAAV